MPEVFRSGPIGRLAAVLLALALPACAGRDGPPPEPAAAEPVAAAERPARVPAVRKPQPPAPAPKAPLPKPKPSEDALPKALGDLIGLTPAQLRSFVGAPDLQEERSPAQVWFYATDSCSLKFSLFPEVASPDYRVLSVEVLDPPQPNDEGRACLRELRTAAVRP